MRLLPLLLLALSAPAAEKPNFVVILCDDLGIGDPGCYNPETKTPMPAVDRLAREGRRWTDMHTPSSVCTPTRYGLLTGRYAWRGRLKQGVLWGFSPCLLEPGRPTIASFLKARGYRSAGAGKWHLGLGDAERTDYSKPLDPGPVSAGFDEFQGIPASLDMEPYVWVKNHTVDLFPSEAIPGSKHQRDGGEGFWRGGPIAPGFRHADVLPRIEKTAVDFLERAAKAPSTPFFLYIPLASPHTPWLPSADVRGKSGAGPYGDFVVQTDRAIGAILGALDRLGLAKDTLVVLTSDNGSHWPAADIEKWGHRANGPWRGQKADIHEGGHRVPFVARWPDRLEAGSTSDATACLTDLFATFAAALGAKVPEGAAEDSHDLFAKDRPPVVHHSSAGLFAIREGPWKLIEGKGSGGFTKLPVRPEDPPGQLYHLGDDPAESRNLYAEKPDVVARLAARLKEIRDR